MKLLLNQDGGPGNGQAQDWTATLGEEAKPVVQAKGWKTPADMFTSYRNLEKVLGNNIAKPQPDWDDAKWGEFWKASGRPETPDKYVMPEADELIKKSPVPIDAARLTKWKGELHKLGLNDRQANALMKTYLEDEFGALNKLQEQERSEREQSEMKLRNDWGGKYEENLKAAQAALDKIGPEFKGFLEKSKLGNHPELVKLFHSISTKIGEDSARSSGSNQGLGATTPESAQAEITKLKGDAAFMTLFFKGDKAAMEKWNQLHQALNPKPA